MARNRRRTRGLYKADKAPAAQTEAVFTPQQAVAIAQALASKAPVNGQTTALPRNPALMQIPFSPGVPLVPSAINSPRPDSGRPEPRAYEFPITANLPGSNDKLVPWQVLRQAADGISIFRKCIEIRKDEFSSLDWDIVVSRKAVMRELRAAGGSTPRAELEQQMQAKLAPEIARVSAWWEEPDRRNGLSWIEWIKKLLEERFVLDALAMYPRRTFGGDLYSLEILDGSTIKPLLDEYGGRPMPPNPAYQQILWGFPRGEFVADLGEDGLPTGVYPADQLIYEVDNVRSWTPYGYSATERALTDGALEVQRKAWLMATYTDGVMPSGWLRAGEGQADWSTAQLAEMERDLNDYYSGITQNRMRLRILPWGMEPVETADQAEKYKPDLDLYLLKLCAGHFSTTIAELGFTEPGGLGSSGYHEGQADVQDRKATRPTVAYVQALINKLSRRHLGMPLELEIKFAGDETEDDAAEDEMADRQVKSARLTINEDRDRRGLARFNFPEADMPFVMGGTGGITFMEGSKQAAEAAQEQAAAIADAKANPPKGDDAGGQSSGRGGSPDKPKDGGDPGKDLDKTADAELVKTELDAYARWARRNPNPRRPFRFQHATPDDVADAEPGRVEFDGWVFVADGGLVLSKVDVAAWNAAHPTHPRGPNGKFVKVGSELHEAALRMARDLEHGNGGKAGHDNITRWEGETPQVQAARKRQDRVDRARAFAEQLANMEEELADGHDTAEVVARVRSAADRSPRHEQLGQFASIIEGHNGDREAMLRSARSWAAEHGLTAVGTPGERVTFDPAKHFAPPFMQREMRDEGGMGQPMQIVKPGYVFNDPEGGEEVRLSKPAIDFPEQPAPVKAPPKAKPRKASAPAVRTHEDDVEAAHRDRVRRQLIDEHNMEERAASALDPTRPDPGPREPTADEITERRRAEAVEAARPIEGEVETPEEELRRGRRRATLEELGLKDEPRQGDVVDSETVDDVRAVADMMRRARAEEMYGHDRHEWPSTEPGTARTRPMENDGSYDHDELVEAHQALEGIDERLDEPGMVDDDFDMPPRDYSDEEILAHARHRRRTTTVEGSVVEGSVVEAEAPVRATATGVDVDGVRQALDAATSREEAGAIIDRLALKVPQLKQLAKDLDVVFGSKDTKAKLRERIVYQKVGARLDSDAIRGVPPSQMKPGRENTLSASSRVLRGGDWDTPPGQPAIPAPVHRPTAPPPVVHEPGAEVLSPAQQRAAARAERLAARNGAPKKRFEDMTEAELQEARDARDARQKANIEAQRAANGGETDWERATRLHSAADRRSGESEYRRVETALDAEQRTMTVKQREIADVEASIADAEASGQDSGSRYERLIDARDALQQEIEELDAKMAPMRGRLEEIRRGEVRKKRTPKLGKADEPDPKAPPPDQRWPAWTVDEQIAAAYTAAIVTALAAGLTTTAALDLARRWLESGLSGTAAATRWLEGQGLHIAERLTEPLSNLHTEAVAAGTRSAQAAIASPPRLIELGVSLTADWGNWTPGDPDAARQILSADGHDILLHNLLSQFGITVKSIAARRIDELAAILADGLEHGRTPDEIAQAVEALTGDRARAYRIAITETARALSAAAVAQYEQDDIPTKGWMNAADQDVCQLCQDNEDAGDIPLPDLFPSGVPFPPAHPHCRCAIVPGVEA